MEETDVQAQAEQAPVRFEIERPEDYGQYLLHAKAEIVAVLRALIERRALVSVYFNQGRSFLLTSVLNVDTANGYIILEGGREDAINSQALQAEQLILTAAVDKVKVQFTLRHLSETRNALGIRHSVPSCPIRYCDCSGASISDSRRPSPNRSSSSPRSGAPMVAPWSWKHRCSTSAAAALV
jgi:hypothetical protein